MERKNSDRMGSGYQPTQAQAQSSLELGLRHMTRAISGVRPDGGEPYTDDEMASLFNAGARHARISVQRANEHGWELDIESTRGRFRP